MKSPFPGMDPFIEGCGLWEDFHSHLIEEIYRHLADAVPARYVVRSAERRYLAVAADEIVKQRPFRPDVSIHTPSSAEAPAQAEESVAVAEPDEVTMRALVEEDIREPFVEILEGEPGNRLVTCIEVLSPSNKRPNTAGWDQYLRRRRGFLQGQVSSLVEIDLLRGGRRMPMADAWPDSPYVLLIARASTMPICKVRQAYFRTPVPAIAVPLLTPDPDVPLDIQPMIDQIYARSKYRRDIDYSQAISPPLNDEDSAWLAQRLR
ncbi:MAG: DUF4058 family protein [Planctomycetes bacterium]|nr:DUF4058 family protein [Planctomycetota bacterium]